MNPAFLDNKRLKYALKRELRRRGFASATLLTERLLRSFVKFTLVVGFVHAETYCTDQRLRAMNGITELLDDIFQLADLTP